MKVNKKYILDSTEVSNAIINYLVDADELDKNYTIDEAHISVLYDKEDNVAIQIELIEEDI